MSDLAADVVVVGSGIIGSAIAYQVARRSDLRVVVVDKATGPAAGSTGASAAISRCRYTEPEVVVMAKACQDIYTDWAHFTGLAEPRSQLTPIGGLWVFDKSDVELEAERAKLAAHGVDVSVLTAAEVKARWPELSTCVAAVDLTGEAPHECADGGAFLFEHRAGYVDPAGANQDLVDAARRHGAEMLFGSEVTAVGRAGGVATGVTLAGGGQIHAPVVVNAAGPWCNQLNELAAIKHRWALTPTRIQVVFRPWTPDGRKLPIVFDGPNACAFRPESGGRQLLFVAPEVPGFADPVDDPDDFRLQPEQEAFVVSMALFQHRVHLGASPQGRTLSHAGRLTGTSGLYTINEVDTHPVVGETELAGFWMANGFSGHGLKLAPAIGSMVAQALTGVVDSSDAAVRPDLFGIDRSPLGTSGKVWA